MKTSTVQTSIMLAIVANAFQYRFDKAGVPYFDHCYTVMKLLGEDADEELKQIALGHDLFEDTKITAADLRAAGFSERVIDGIMSMTKHRGQSYDEYKAQVMANADAVKTKKKDLTHNSDIRRMKDGASQKDFERTIAYMKFFAELDAI